MIVETDHKPLLGIVNKAIALCSPRIQRMRLLLQTYEFQLVYKPGKELHIADALSRAPEVRQFVDDSSQFSDENVNMLVLSAVLVPTSHEKFIAAIYRIRRYKQCCCTFGMAGPNIARAVAQQQNYSGSIEVTLVSVTVFC